MDQQKSHFKFKKKVHTSDSLTVVCYLQIKHPATSKKVTAN